MDLHIHPNSVRYRIGRAEELIGGSLRELSTIVDVYLAVQVIARARAGSTSGPQVWPRGEVAVADRQTGDANA